jgi:hypothetical protein
MQHAADQVTGKTREFAQNAGKQSAKATNKMSQGLQSFRKSFEGIFK